MSRTGVNDIIKEIRTQNKKKIDETIICIVNN